MLDSLWHVLFFVSLLWISFDLIGLRREVKEVLHYCRVFLDTIEEELAAEALSEVTEDA